MVAQAQCSVFRSAFPRCHVSRRSCHEHAPAAAPAAAPARMPTRTPLPTLDILASHCAGALSVLPLFISPSRLPPSLPHARPPSLSRPLPQALRPDGSGALDLSDNDLGDAGCELLAQQGSRVAQPLAHTCLRSQQGYGSTAPVCYTSLLSQQGATLLGSLRRLNMSGNQVSSAGVEALARALASGAASSLLQELNLSRNRIEHLPNSLAALAHLEHLGLHENPGLVSPPPHVVKAGTAAVLAFLIRGWRLESRQLCACCSRVFCARSRRRSPGIALASPVKSEAGDVALPTGSADSGWD